MNRGEYKSKDLSILVYSCWKNSDMWDVFLKLFNKYWSDCIYRVILLTDKIENTEVKWAGFDEIVVLDGTWNEMLFAGMNTADTEYAMLWMDDYLLCDYVKNEDINLYLNIARRYGAANVRLHELDFTIAKLFAQDSNLSQCIPGSAYSLSTQIGIWNVKLLRKYIEQYESPWDFERKGSLEIKDYKHPILVLHNYVFPYEEGVRRGKWMDNGVKLCKRNNIRLDFNKRKRMSNFEMAWIYIKGGILEKNPKFILRIQNCYGNIVDYVKFKKKYHKRGTGKR